MCHNYEDFGMIHQLADFIEENKIQLFVVNTVDRESWSPKDWDKKFRAARLKTFEEAQAFIRFVQGAE